MSQGTAESSTRDLCEGLLEEVRPTTEGVCGDNDVINIKDVAIGEVWLCAEQSNMGWSMGNSFEAEQEADVNLPDFRIFKSAREHWHAPLEMQRDRLSQWKPCVPASAAETSAVSYYFGKKLHQELAVPVGLIQQAYAGTPGNDTVASFEPREGGIWIY